MKVGLDRAALPSDVLDALRRLIGMLRQPPAGILHLAASPAEPGAPDDDAVRSATMWLYQDWYCQDDQPHNQPVLPGRADMSSALRVAVADSGRWETGWVTMQGSPDGTCVAGRRDRSRRLSPGQYANIARPGMAPQPGDGLAVNMLLDWTDPQTGFWHVQASAGEPTGPLTRLYWNTGWRDAGAVLRELTAVLDGKDLRYALKCPAEAAGFTRVDSLVVYLERDGWERIAPAIQELGVSLRASLGRSVPPLTRRLADGVAWAEDPGDGTSFGDSRCQTLAPGALALLRTTGGWSDDQALEALLNVLRDGGIDPATPWMSPGVPS